LKNEKKLDENDLVRKWRLPFREGVKITYNDLGILDVIIHGETEITAKDFEQMKMVAKVIKKVLKRIKSQQTELELRPPSTLF
jgi:hypothetical protein